MVPIPPATDPAARDYGAKSGDRVHKSYFYGSKHIDAHVPKCDPNPRMQLTTLKQNQWSNEAAPVVPQASASYVSQNSGTYVTPGVPMQRSSFARRSVKY